MRSAATTSTPTSISTAPACSPKTSPTPRAAQEALPRNTGDDALEKLTSLPEAQQFLKPGITFLQLDAQATAMSDNEAAQRLNEARRRCFNPSTVDSSTPPDAPPSTLWISWTAPLRRGSRPSAARFPVDEPMDNPAGCPQLAHRPAAAHELHRVSSTDSYFQKSPDNPSRSGSYLNWN